MSTEIDDFQAAIKLALRQDSDPVITEENDIHAALTRIADFPCETGTLTNELTVISWGKKAVADQPNAYTTKVNIQTQAATYQFFVLTTTEHTRINTRRAPRDLSSWKQLHADLSAAMWELQSPTTCTTPIEINLSDTTSPSSVFDEIDNILHTREGQRETEQLAQQREEQNVWLYATDILGGFYQSPISGTVTISDRFSLHIDKGRVQLIDGPDIRYDSGDESIDITDTLTVELLREFNAAVQAYEHSTTPIEHAFVNLRDLLNLTSQGEDIPLTEAVVQLAREKGCFILPAAPVFLDIVPSRFMATNMPFIIASIEPEAERHHAMFTSEDGSDSGWFEEKHGLQFTALRWVGRKIPTVVPFTYEWRAVEERALKRLIPHIVQTGSQSQEQITTLLEQIAHDIHREEEAERMLHLEEQERTQREAQQALEQQRVTNKAEAITAIKTAIAEHIHTTGLLDIPPDEIIPLLVELDDAKTDYKPDSTKWTVKGFETITDDNTSDVAVSLIIYRGTTPYSLTTDGETLRIQKPSKEPEIYEDVTDKLEILNVLQATESGKKGIPIDQETAVIVETINPVNNHTLIIKWEDKTRTFNRTQNGKPGSKNTAVVIKEGSTVMGEQSHEYIIVQSLFGLYKNQPSLVVARGPDQLCYIFPLGNIEKRYTRVETGTHRTVNSRVFVRQKDHLLVLAAAEADYAYNALEPALSNLPDSNQDAAYKQLIIGYLSAQKLPKPQSDAVITPRVTINSGTIVIHQHVNDPLGGHYDVGSIEITRVANTTLTEEQREFILKVTKWDNQLLPALNASAQRVYTEARNTNTVLAIPAGMERLFLTTDPHQRKNLPLQTDRKAFDNSVRIRVAQNTVYEFKKEEDEWKLVSAFVDGNGGKLKTPRAIPAVVEVKPSPIQTAAGTIFTRKSAKPTESSKPTDHPLHVLLTKASKNSRPTVLDESLVKALSEVTDGIKLGDYIPQQSAPPQKPQQQQTLNMDEITKQLAGRPQLTESQINIGVDTIFGNIETKGYDDKTKKSLRRAIRLCLMSPERYIKSDVYERWGDQIIGIVMPYRLRDNI